MSLQRTLVSALLLLALVAQGQTVFARSQRNIPYRVEVTWTTALRLLRVDLGFQLLERDQDAKFVLFQYIDGNQSHSGSLEMVERLLEDGRTGVRVIVAVPAMPTYVELHLLDRLERKLRDEVGPPLPVAVRVTRDEARETEEESDDQEGEREERETEERDD